MNNIKFEFTKLVKEYKKTIYTVCYFFSKDPEEVNDLFQEALTNLYEAIIYVPIGSYLLYNGKEGWNYPIEEYDVAGIDGVTSDNQSAKIKGIYTLSGQKVNNTIPGNIYIFIDENGRKVKRLVK